MVSKRKTTTGKLAPYIDVRKQSDVPMFESMIKTGPVIVLVYADWCGHCKQFKQTMWDDVANSSNKAMNTAAVHYDMVDKTSMKNANIEGYPTLFQVKEGKSVAVSTPQNKEELVTMVNERSNRIMRNSQAAAKNAVFTTQEENLASFQPEAVESLPPAIEDITEPKSERRPSAVQAGGSLLETLLKVSADTAHAVVLTGSAIEINRQLKKRRQKTRKVKSKKQQQKQTRRR